MQSVFLLEDVETDAQLAERALVDVAGRNLEFLRCRSKAEAIEILTERTPGTLFPLIIDLCVPASPNETVDVEKDWTNGIAVVREAWRLGHRRGLVVWSGFADSVACKMEVHELLEKEGIQPELWLAKDQDLCGLEDWQSYFGPLLDDLVHLKLILHHHGVLVVDPTQEKFLQDVVTVVRAACEHPGRCLTALLITGPTGEGKSFWAATALPAIKSYVLTGTGDATADFAHGVVNLPAIVGDKWTDAEKAALFGTRGWTGEGVPPYADGEFIRATEYRPRTGRRGLETVIVKNNPNDVVVDRLQSRVLVLDEVLSCAPVVHDALLSVLSEGLVPTTGSQGVQFPVGPFVVFTTNLNLDVVAGTHTEQRGKMGAAFRRRMDDHLEFPEMASWSFCSVLEYLELKGRRVAPAALGSLRELHDARALTADTLEKVLSRKATKRLTKEQLRPLLTKVRAGTSSKRGVEGLPQEEADLHAGMRAWERVVHTQGSEIRNDVLLAGSLLNLSPSAVLGLLIVAWADVLAHRQRRKDVLAWLGGGSLRHKLVSLSDKYPAIFVGSGKERVKGKERIVVRTVRMRDLKEWAMCYLDAEGMP